MAQGSPVLVITGASSGIGAATARRAVEAGHRVVLAARSEDKLRGLAEELGGDDRALVVRCAVTGMAESARLELNGTGVRVTLVEPGKVDTPFFDQRPDDALEADDIARAV